ncbi:MAG: hypothetical protein K1X61_08865 [Chitinophagales bacterium]|nr:hypothetical protein [Chitinophagales bacterium]
MIHHRHFSNSVISCLLCICVASAFSQTAPVKEWDKSYGNIRSDDMYMLILTNDGGYLLGGDSDSPLGGDKSQGSQGLNDYWIVKTDALGNKQWDRRFGGNSNEELYSILQTPDNGFLLGGWTQSNVNGDQTQASRGGRDYWIVRTDANGIKLWDKRFGGPDDDEMRAMIQTADGGFLLAGESRSSIGSEKSQNNHGVYDVWVVKTDALGNKQWDASYGGTDDDRLNAVQQTADGGYILGAWTISPPGFDVTETGKGSTDMWLVKADANGMKLWDHRFGGDDNEYMYALDQTNDGGFMLAGYTRSELNGDVTVAGKGAYDFWLVKTDGNGVKLWDNRLGGPSDDKGKSIYELEDGGFIVGGWSESDAGGDKSQDTQGLTDYWLVRTDAAGNKIWDLDVGANNDERLHDVPRTADGGFIIGGHSSSGMNGDKSQPNKGLSDYWVVKLAAEVPTAVFYADNDGDGFGDLMTDTLAMFAPDGYVADHSDCNDQNANVNPLAADVCNLLDDNCNGQADENSFVAALSPAGTVEVCKGTDVTLFADTTAGLLYQWVRDGVLILNATGNSYTTSQQGSYQVKEINGFNCYSIAPPTTINTLSKPDAIITPAGSLDICTSGSVLLQANAGANLSYQWKKDGSKVNGATAQNYSATMAGVYKVVVTKKNGCKKTSPAATVIKTCRFITPGQVKPDEMLTVYPNPSDGDFMISVPFSQCNIPATIGGMVASIRLMNSLGQTVYEEIIAPVNEVLTTSIPAEALPNGSYVLQVLINGKNNTEQLQWIRQVVIQR